MRWIVRSPNQCQWRIKGKNILLLLELLARAAGKYVEKEKERERTKERKFLFKQIHLLLVMLNIFMIRLR